MEDELDGSECQIFLSHSGQQKLIVEDLFGQLRRILRDRPESTVFFDRSGGSIDYGDNIFDNIAKGIKSCKVGVLVLSPNFLESKWPMIELEGLFERTLEEDPISLYPIFYNTRDINNTLKSEDTIVEQWGETWKTFKEDEEVDVQKWAQYVVQVKEMRGTILKPNETVEMEIYNIAMRVAAMLPESLCAPRPLPPPPSQADYTLNALVEIGKQPAQCQYTTFDTFMRAQSHVSFYMQPVGYNGSLDNHRPRPGLLGQRPEPGSPDESIMIDTLMFVDGEQAQLNSVPIEAGNEWWELIWTDHGSVLYQDDHSCWRVKEDRIPQGYVCLSPYFFKIDTLEQRMSDPSFSENYKVLKEDYMPPSDEDIEGMVAIREDLVTYVTEDELIKVWEDRDSGFTTPLAIYTGPGSAGCFAFTTDDAPTPGKYPIMNRTKFR